MASRILGLGDVLTLIEKVEATVDAEAAKKLAAKTATGEFTLEDLRDQLASMKKMGPLEGLLDLLPKGGAFKALKQPESVDEKALTRVSAIIDSMTVEETALSPGPERQPQEADRRGLGNVRGRDQPPSQAVPADAPPHADGKKGRPGAGPLQAGPARGPLTRRRPRCRMRRF